MTERMRVVKTWQEGEAPGVGEWYACTDDGRHWWWHRHAAEWKDVGTLRPCRPVPGCEAREVKQPISEALTFSDQEKSDILWALNYTSDGGREGSPLKNRLDDLMDKLNAAGWE